MSAHVVISVDQIFPSVKYTEVASNAEVIESSTSSSKQEEHGDELSSREFTEAEEMVCLIDNGDACQSTAISSTSVFREIQRQNVKNIHVCDNCPEDGVNGTQQANETGVPVNLTTDAPMAISRESLGLDNDGGAPSQNEVVEVVSVVVPIEARPNGSKKATNLPGVAECRICQEEDEIVNLESPCACSGSLKFAHRKCVQHWCNEKGDTICEICQKPFEGGYAIPQPVRADSMPVNIDAGWDIASGQPRLFALAADHHFLESEYDEYAESHAQSAACFRSIALILVALLLLRHIISMTGVEEDEDLSTFFLLSLVRAAGFLIPCYIMARAMNALQIRRQRQEAAMAAAAEVTYLFQTGRVQGMVTAEPQA